MSLVNELRKRAKQIVPQVFGLALASYFAYHLVSGDRSVGAYLRVTQELAEARTLEATLAAEETAQRRLVTGLRSESLDPDLLEERARAVLNMARPDEFVVMTPESGLPSLN